MYQIVRSKTFDDQLVAISRGFARMAEFDDAIDWYLARTPKAEYHIGGECYVWVTDNLPYDTLPSVRIVYRVDDATQTVHLQSIVLR